LNSDLNASRNLAHNKLDERQVAVKQPYIHSDELECSLRAIDSEVMDKSPLL